MLGLTLSPGSTVGAISDKNRASSGGLDDDGYLINAADGVTSKVRDRSAFSVRIFYDQPFKDKLWYSSGIWFTNRILHIRNVDGEAYSGTSRYRVSHVELPFLGKYYASDLGKGVELMFKMGPVLGVKVSENMQSNHDGAHYWNLAKNNEHLDPVRGKNASGEEKELFGLIHLGLHMEGGVEYSINDKITLTSSLSYQLGITGLLNHTLRHDDTSQTRVTDGLSWRAHVFTFNLGIYIPSEFFRR